MGVPNLDLIVFSLNKSSSSSLVGYQLAVWIYIDALCRCTPAESQFFYYGCGHLYAFRCKEQNSVSLVKISFCIMNLDAYEQR